MLKFGFNARMVQEEKLYLMMGADGKHIIAS